MVCADVVQKRISNSFVCVFMRKILMMHENLTMSTLRQLM